MKKLQFSYRNISFVYAKKNKNITFFKINFKIKKSLTIVNLLQETNNKTIHRYRFKYRKSKTKHIKIRNN